MKLKRIIAGCLCAGLCFLTACQQDNANIGDSKTVVNDDAHKSKNIEGNAGDVKLNNGDKYAVIKIKDFGEITVKLYPDAAPVGVQNFIDLADSGFYSGKKFHRIMADFMAQGGAAGENDKDTGSFGIETNYKMRHFYGAFCYANAMGSNTSQFYIVNNKKSQDLTTYSISSVENYATVYEQTASGYDKNSYEYKQYMFQADTYRRTAEFLKNTSDDIVAKYKEKGGAPSLDGSYTVFGQTVDGFDVLDKISAVDVAQNPDTNTVELSRPKTDVIIESVTIKTFGE